MTVDLFGRCADHADIDAGAGDRGIPLVEDAAESLGATPRRPPGRARSARAAALSFNGNKIMTTSGGGMLLSDDEPSSSGARYLGRQARQPCPVVRAQPRSAQLPPLQPPRSLGRAQLSRLDKMTTRRQAHQQTGMRRAWPTSPTCGCRPWGSNPAARTRQLLAHRSRSSSDP